jgi:peptidoglycan LD-endopeptidase CwlK
MAVDERSERNIKTLKPEVQPLARSLIEQAKALGINAKVISGYRSYEEQDALYAQGRTAPGPKVTKARAGYSWHNFGLAFDIGIFSEDGKEYYGASPDYAKVGALGEKLGLTWGGSWDFHDPPHFQFNPHDLTLAEIRTRVSEDKDLFA